MAEETSSDPDITKVCTGCGLEQPDKNEECGACGLTAFSSEVVGSDPDPEAPDHPELNGDPPSAEPGKGAHDLSDPNCDSCEFLSKAQDIPRSMEHHYDTYHPDGE